MLCGIPDFGPQANSRFEAGIVKYPDAHGGVKETNAAHSAASAALGLRALFRLGFCAMSGA